MLSMYHLQSVKIFVFLCLIHKFCVYEEMWSCYTWLHFLGLCSDYTSLLSRHAFPDQKESPPQVGQSIYSHSENFWSWSNSSGVRETQRSSLIFKLGLWAWGQERRFVHQGEAVAKNRAWLIAGMRWTSLLGDFSRTQVSMAAAGTLQQIREDLCSSSGNVILCVVKVNSEILALPEKKRHCEWER